ncbi:VOC family protein [Ramlibacter sp.]|uniref:VOC family protein n=1 Tax=Ramlibacter sp. TaxID=1917967 RepID=UPI003D105F16
MPQLDSYIFFDGACAEAMRYYERTIGGKLEALMKYSDAPGQESCAGVDTSAGDRIMHACLMLDGRMLMASDTPAGMPQPKMASFALALNYATADEARKIFDKLADGGSVTMPMAETFWTDAFGMLTDRFGTPWMVGGGPKPRP